ncbi:MAG: thioesterase family protein [Desulfobacterales bacterium]|jgi:fluoroacetyl-CoA thioesterase
MASSLQPGMTFDFTYQVPADKTVPHLYPDIEEGAVMPEVFATGYLVGLLEFACIRFINPHIDWPREQSVGIGIQISHSAATPPGFTIRVEGRLEAVEAKKLTFSLKAHDGVDQITTGTHERFIINAEKFNQGVALKKGQLGGS